MRRRRRRRGGTETEEKRLKGGGGSYHASVEVDEVWRVAARAVDGGRAGREGEEEGAVAAAEVRRDGEGCEGVRDWKEGAKRPRARQQAAYQRRNCNSGLRVGIPCGTATWHSREAEKAPKRAPVESRTTSRHGARFVVRPTKRVKEQPSRPVVKSSRHLRRCSEGSARERKRTCSEEASSLGVPSHSVGSLQDEETEARGQRGDIEETMRTTRCQ